MVVMIQVCIYRCLNHTCKLIQVQTDKSQLLQLVKLK